MTLVILLRGRDVNSNIPIRICPGDEAPWEYWVPADAVLDASRLVHENLESIVDLFLQDGANRADPVAPAAEWLVKLNKLIAKLQMHGNRLGAALTNPVLVGSNGFVDSGRNAIDFTSELRAYLAAWLSRQGSTDIEVIVPYKIDLPVRLICFPTSKAEPMPGSIHLLANCWGLIHRVTKRRSDTKSNFDTALTGDERSVLLSIITRSIHIAAETKTGIQWDGGPANCRSEADFQRTAGAHRHLARIFFFLSHANGSTMLLDSDEYLTASALSEAVDDGLRRSVIIANGCRTGRSFLVSSDENGDYDSSFGSILLGYEYKFALVGLEAKVPTYFAWRFGLALMRQIAESHNTPGEALRLLTGAHFPLGLLYCAIGPSALHNSMFPPFEFGRLSESAFTATNFCLQELGPIVSDAHWARADR